MIGLLALLLAGLTDAGDARRTAARSNEVVNRLGLRERQPVGVRARLEHAWATYCRDDRERAVVLWMVDTVAGSMAAGAFARPATGSLAIEVDGTVPGVSVPATWGDGRKPAEDDGRIWMPADGQVTVVDPFVAWIARESVREYRGEGRDWGSPAAIGLAPKTWRHGIASNIREALHWVMASPEPVDLMTMDLGEAHERAKAFWKEMSSREGKAIPGAVVTRFPDGWTIQRLTQKKQLETEGSVMENCLQHGYYWDDVRDGKAEIYSLRDPEGGSHVTMAWDPTYSTEDGGGWVEIKGPNNERVPVGLETKVASFLMDHARRNGLENQAWMIGEELTDNLFATWHDPILQRLLHLLDVDEEERPIEADRIRGLLKDFVEHKKTWTPDEVPGFLRDELLRIEGGWKVVLQALDGGRVTEDIVRSVLDYNHDDSQILELMEIAKAWSDPRLVRRVKEDPTTFFQYVRAIGHRPELLVEFLGGLTERRGAAATLASKYAVEILHRGSPEIETYFAIVEKMARGEGMMTDIVRRAVERYHRFVVEGPTNRFRVHDQLGLAWDPVRGRLGPPGLVADLERTVRAGVLGMFGLANEGTDFPSLPGAWSPAARTGRQAGAVADAFVRAVEAAYKASHELSAPVEGVVAAISAWLVGDEAVRPYIETAALKLPLVLFEGRRLFVVRPETLQWPDVFTFKLGDELKVKMIHGSALPTPVRLLVQGGVEIPFAHPEVETLIDRSDLAGRNPDRSLRPRWCGGGDDHRRLDPGREDRVPQGTARGRRAPEAVNGSSLDGACYTW
jgi:hypothetical protein